MKNTRVARRYAAALMAVAEETGSVEAVAKDCNALRSMIEASRELRLLMASPIVRAHRKREVFRELLTGRFGPTVRNFVLLMTSKQRENLLPEVLEQYAALRDERMGIVTVDVTTVSPMTAEQEKALGDRLERRTGKKVRLRTARNAALKGGMIVRIGDTVLDASVRRQLELLRKRFAGESRTSA